MFLGIDVGTGGTRAVLIDRGGVVLASASSDHAPIYSPHIGWAEQDPQDWWRAAREAIAAVMATSGVAGNEIDAIGLTGQMHGCVMLDADGQVLRSALIWCDQRTQPQCDWLTEKIGFERLIELTCNPALPNFTLTKLLWVRDHQPEIFGRIAHVLCPKDYIRYCLTGEFAMDMQEASGTLLLDVTHRRWSLAPYAVSSRRCYLGLRQHYRTRNREKRIKRTRSISPNAKRPVCRDSNHLYRADCDRRRCPHGALRSIRFLSRHLRQSRLPGLRAHRTTRYIRAGRNTGTSGRELFGAARRRRRRQGHL